MIHAKFLQTLDWGILVGYFAILFAIGIWACLLYTSDAADDR